VHLDEKTRFGNEESGNGVGRGKYLKRKVAIRNLFFFFLSVGKTMASTDTKNEKPKNLRLKETADNLSDEDWNHLTNRNPIFASLGHF
jgi:hypothetical protein